VLGVQGLQSSRFDFLETRYVHFSFSLMAERGLWSEFHTAENEEVCFRLRQHFKWAIQSQRGRLNETDRVNENYVDKEVQTTTTRCLATDVSEESVVFIFVVWFLFNLNMDTVGSFELVGTNAR
jgi:hypothetical protein